MKDFLNGLLGLSKTLILAGAAVIGLIVLMMGVIFGMCLA